MGEAGLAARVEWSWQEQPLGSRVPVLPRQRTIGMGHRGDLLTAGAGGRVVCFRFLCAASKHEGRAQDSLRYEML